MEGVEKVEGSSYCAHHVWTFQGVTDKYTISERGCYPDSNPPPKGITGGIVISESGTEPKHYWCY
jgi:hypothetical protein